jgi:hypothetical protein
MSIASLETQRKEDWKIETDGRRCRKYEQKFGASIKIK